MTGQSKLPFFLKILGITLLIVNLSILNYQVFFVKNKEPSPRIITDISETTAGKFTPAESSAVTLKMVTDMVQEATAALSQKIDTLILAPEPTPVVITNTINKTNSETREMYIPLGTGSSSGSDWTDLPGVEAYIAPGNYGSIKEMYFAASIRVPSGNGRIYARLKNVTDSVSLFESEVSSESTTGMLISSGKLPIPQTTKLYRVQLKSSLGAQAVLDNAFIKLFAQ